MAELEQEVAQKFPPAADFAAQANWNDPTIYETAAADPDAFWAGQAEQLVWSRKWDTVSEWNPPHAKWFLGGQLNVSVNCLDRHVEGGRADKAAIVFEGEPGDTKTYTYAELHQEVCKFANVLQSQGVQRGDRVTIYLPMIPEAAIAMLACARIGAPHSVVFGGFSADSLRERIHDSGSKLLITADGGWRRGGVVKLKEAADQALAGETTIEHVIVVNRTGKPEETPWTAGRDLWWHELASDASDQNEAVALDSEDLLFILYTSGSTGKPKGIAHTTGGYLTGATTTCKYIFDLKDDDVYWCTADVGWITGHSYVVYGPLSNGATVFMYEGAPDWPARDRFWELIEKHKITILYTAPTAIRAFMKWGTEWPEKHDLSSLRLLGSVGEPINPEAWLWYHKNVGGERCPIVDTWWQTETGAIMITPLPGISATKPASASRPFPGVSALVVDEKGDPLPEGGEGVGLLVITKPWPSMLRTLWGDDARYKEVYWSKFADKGYYFAGDGAKRDAEGDYWLLGRVDDVMNVAGHRVSTMEVESALVDHPSVAEAAVIGKAHDIKGQAISAFVTLKEGIEPSPELMAELKAHVAKKIGAICRPDDLFLTAELPKTRSGKIMRRLLRDIAEGRALGDTTTLADPSVVSSLKDKYTDES
ncbi:acetyl-coenzyme A synthetase [Capsulimonas corticalis]|uniref:Acetyl-coenzyme A synthetase n=1 Tax=Capsulimonas corticalis TaxID=2219043 RepID=A0A402CQC6_9BACT|nr:acetate--CoA ligase [Capsulimonas corticalis]BDI32709.1 acetyl-coenzyme A synthetase [Capsulimonas corticalis]